MLSVIHWDPWILHGFDNTWLPKLRYRVDISDPSPSLWLNDLTHKTIGQSEGDPTEWRIGTACSNHIPLGWNSFWVPSTLVVNERNWEKFRGTAGDCLHEWLVWAAARTGYDYQSNFVAYEAFFNSPRQQKITKCILVSRIVTLKGAYATGFCDKNKN